MRRIVYYNASKTAFRPFKIKVNSGADSKFTIPTFGTGYNYRAKVAGVVDVSGLTGDYTINFPSANTDYILEISGLFPWWVQGFNAERLKVKDVMQWGDVVWKSFSSAFWGCENAVDSAIDIPNTSLVKSYNRAFGYSNMNPNINLWNFESAEDLQYMLFYNTSFNRNLTGMNVSKVESTYAMLQGCYSFQQEVDWSDPITGSISLTNASGVISGSSCKSLKLRCDVLEDFIDVAGNPSNPFASSLLETLYLINCKVDIPLTGLGYGGAPILSTIEIDALANSAADLTGLTGKVVKMKPAQYVLCNPLLWTNKNWTIVQIP